jgi:hypothetical protein
VIRTPAASITVRGTIFDVFVKSMNETWLLLIEGGVEVCTQSGKCLVHDQPGKLIRITADNVEKPMRWTKLDRERDTSFDSAFPFVVTPPYIDPTPIFVGQDLFEEVGFVTKGSNAGWKHREGRHCYAPKEGCKTEGLQDPFVEYGRDEGTSVTGGVVATGDGVPGLKGRYVYGDFVSGRLWAVTLPEKVEEKPAQLEPEALGKWPLLPSHFFNDPSGDVWLLDFAGRMLRIVSPAAAQP